MESASSSSSDASSTSDSASSSDSEDEFRRNGPDVGVVLERSGLKRKTASAATGRNLHEKANKSKSSSVLTHLQISSIFGSEKRIQVTAISAEFLRRHQWV